MSKGRICLRESQVQVRERAWPTGSRDGVLGVQRQRKLRRLASSAKIRGSMARPRHCPRRSSAVCRLPLSPEAQVLQAEGLHAFVAPVADYCGSKHDMEGQAMSAPAGMRMRHRLRGCSASRAQTAGHRYCSMTPCASAPVLTIQCNRDIEHIWMKSKDLEALEGGLLEV